MDWFESSSDVRVGAMLCGKYRIDSVLGTGGMATVYAVTHRNGAELAIKVLSPDLAAHPEVRARFLREAYATNGVKHRGVLRILDDGETEGGAPFLVMERLRGRNADELASQNGRLGARVAVAIMDQVLDVLAAAHRESIVHRDVKPGNVFVTLDGEVKVLDFGIARVRDVVAVDPALTGGSSILGTPAYMSPEHARPGMDEVDEKSDIWSAGATLFSLLTGRTVHDGTPLEIMARAATHPAPPLAKVARYVPEAIAEVVDGALAYEKGERWKSAEEMRTALLAAHRLHFGHGPEPGRLSRFVRGDSGPARSTERVVARAVGDFDSAPRLHDATPTRTSAPCAIDTRRKPVVLRVRPRARPPSHPLALAAALALITFWIVVAATFRPPNEGPVAQRTAANGEPLVVTPVSLPVASRSAVVAPSGADAGIEPERPPPQRGVPAP
jgi:serine/threonine protein kinase